MYELANLRSLLEILSGPQFLDALNFHIKRYTCSSVTGVNANCLDTPLLMYRLGSTCNWNVLGQFFFQEQKC